MFFKFRSFSSAKIYKKVWSEQYGSPLLYNTEQLTQVLQKKLPNVDVKFAMRYQSPSIKSVLDEILNKNPDELIRLQHAVSKWWVDMKRAVYKNINDVVTSYC